MLTQKKQSGLSFSIISALALTLFTTFPAHSQTMSIAQSLLAGALRNSNLSAVTTKPSPAAKALDDWHGETFDGFAKFYESKITSDKAETDPRKALANAFGMVLGDDLTRTFFMQYSFLAMVQPVVLTFENDKDESDVRWVHRCINVSTFSYAKSPKIKRRLNGSFAPGQVVAFRTVTVFGSGTGAADRAERKDLSPQLSAITGVQYAKIFFMEGKTDDNNEIVFTFKPEQFGSETLGIKTLIVPKSVPNSKLQSTFANLNKDCPLEWK